MEAEYLSVKYICCTLSSDCGGGREEVPMLPSRVYYCKNCIIPMRFRQFNNEVKTDNLGADCP
jgi:hypothetical protein